jgi:hypothetical protein
MLDYFSPFATTETESLVSVAFRGFGLNLPRERVAGKASLRDNCAPGDHADRRDIGFSS